MNRSIPLAVALLTIIMTNISPSDEVGVFFGTNTPKNGLSQGIYQGIYQGTFNTTSGKLTNIAVAAEVSSPGFLTKHPSLPILYSIGRADGEPSVFAFEIVDSKAGARLVGLNRQPIGDGGAAHLSTDQTGSVLMTAQYGSGSVAVFPLNKDGSIKSRSDLQKHQGGSGVVGNRQDKPHAHWVGTSPDNRFVFVPDLGMDQVLIYELDVDSGTLTPHSHGQCPPGGGPRHMKFAPDGKRIYVLNELALSITVFDYDAQAGTMNAGQTIPTLSDEIKAKEAFNSAAEIRVHPSGKFVYSSNRGHDSISVFRVDDQTGELSLTEVEPIRGAWPRNFNLDPTGKFLLAAGGQSNTIAVFSIDQVSGELSYTRENAMVPTCICVEFAP